MSCTVPVSALFVVGPPTASVRVHLRSHHGGKGAATRDGQPELPLGPATTRGLPK